MENIRQNSLHNLAHVANLSKDLHILDGKMKGENAQFTYRPKDVTNDSMTTESNNILMKNGKLKRIACVECRQQKSKCDAHEKFPAPCSRCSKKELQCNLKSDYKRTYKRARIAQIEKEFSELKKNLNSSEGLSLLKKLPLLSSTISALDSSKNGAEVIQTEDTRALEPDGVLLGNQGSYSKSSQSDSSLPSSYSFQNVDYPTQNLMNVPSVSQSIENISNEKNIIDEDHVTLSDEQLACEEKSMGTVTLSSGTIKSLFEEYVKHYHPILPVVNVSRGPSKIFRLCPALFWVIMLISLRRFHDDSSKKLLLEISPLVKEILEDISISPITRFNPSIEDEPIYNACSVYSVQAFLIYTFWPPITSSLSADSSWNTIGVATFQAIRIGLHTPSTFLDGKNTAKLTSAQQEIAEESTRTWITCNVVSQTIATAFGYPAFVQFESSIWNSYRPDSLISIPRRIKCLMEIASFEDQVSKTFNSNPVSLHGLIEASEMLPMLKIFMKRLDETEMRMTSDLQGGNEFQIFQLLSAKVHLLTYFFMNTDNIASFELQKGLVLLYNASIALINHALYFQASDKKFMKYIPGVYLLQIWQTSCILVKLIHSPIKSIIDIGSGRQSYEGAISLIAKASILKHDMAHRSSGIMRNMWQLFRSLDLKNSTSLGITIRNRRSASLFFDCLLILREKVGMQKLNARNEEHNSDEVYSRNGELSTDSEEYGYQEEAVISQEEDEQDDSLKETPGSAGTGKASQKSTPGSHASVKTKKLRSLSGTADAELNARRIIQTIPLDPQPISIKRRNEGIPSKERLNESIISTSPAKDEVQWQDKISPESNSFSGNELKTADKHTSGSLGESNRNESYYPHLDVHLTKQKQQLPNNSQHSNLNVSNTIIDDNSNNGMNSLDIDIFNFENDILWKDVDTVMNDFGFHTK